jgi:hypothetical protein
MGLVWDKQQQGLVHRCCLYGGISFMKQQFVETHRCTVIWETKTPDNSVISQQVSVFYFCENIRTGYFLHNILTEGAFVPQPSGTAAVSVWRRPILGNTLNLWKWELFTWFYRILSLTLHLLVYRTTWTLLDTWVSGVVRGVRAGALRCVLWRANGGSGIAECVWAPYTRRILLNWIYMADISCNGCRTRKRRMQSPFLIPHGPT